MIKQCTKCRTEKDISEFYKTKQGYDPVCKKCKHEYYLLNKEKISLRKKKKYYLEAGYRDQVLLKRKEYVLKNKDKVKQAFKKWNQSDKGKMFRNKFYKRLKAYWAIKELKKKGFEKLNCQMCGNKDSQAHHEDYNKPLEVIWLCEKCHSSLHKTYRKQQFITQLNYDS
jgi:hypothetical protein